MQPPLPNPLPPRLQKERKRSLDGFKRAPRQRKENVHLRFNDEVLPKLRPKSAFTVFPRLGEWWDHPKSRTRQVSQGLVGAGFVLLVSLGTAGFLFGFVSLDKKPVAESHVQVLPALEMGEWEEIALGYQFVEEPGAAANDEIETKEAPIFTLDQSFADAREEDIETARDVLWRFVVAESPEDRIALARRPQINGQFIRDHHQRNPGLVVEYVRIEPLRAWHSPQGLKIAFKTFTNFNRTGCIVEVVCNDRRDFQISWQRFVQHHYETFPQFYVEKPAQPQRFYLTARRRHVLSSDPMPSWCRVDSYAISGTNPNQFATAFVYRNSLVADELKEAVPWSTQPTIKASVVWRSNPDNPDEKFLFVDEFLGGGWSGDLR